MSLQDRLASQDAFQLLTLGTSLSLVTASSITGAAYNFPLMLYGIVAHEMRSSTNPFRQFLILVGFTAIFDLYTLLVHNLSRFITLVTFLLLLLKVPIFLTGLAQLRERGGDLRWSQASLPFQGLNTGVGQSNWTLPGGFTPGQPAQAPPPPPGTFPSSGGFRLGTEDESEESQPPPPPPQTGRGGYQTIG